MFNFKNISIIILIFVLLLNLLLDFSFVTNNFGKNLREFTFNYIVPFKNTTTTCLQEQCHVAEEIMITKFYA